MQGADTSVLPSVGSFLTARCDPSKAQSVSEGESRYMDRTSRLILNAAGDGIYGLDLAGHVTFMNPAATALTGWSIEDLEGHTQHSMMHHSYSDGSPYPPEECPIYQALRDGRVHHREDEVFWRKNGSSFQVSYTSTPILCDGVPAGAVILFSDITQRLKEQAWEKSKSALFASILAQDSRDVTLTILANTFQALHAGVWLAFHARRKHNLILLAGASLPAVLQKGLETVPIASDSCACGRAAFWAKEQVWYGGCGCISNGLGYHQCLPILSSAGEVLGTLSVFSDVHKTDLKQIRSAVLNAVDVTRLALEHSNLQQQLRHQAQHDLLTGLPNRMLLQDRLDQALTAAKRRGTCVGVCYIDLDRFKQVNDTLGHGVGDEYLKKITSILHENSRAVDTLARQGGDEFIMLLPDVNHERDVEEIAARLLKAVREPFSIEGNSFNAAASIGISVYPQHGESHSLLLQNADTALYAAKRDGRNRAKTYHSDMGSEVKEHAWIYSGLQQALLNRQFRLVYQPIYSLQEELTGFEALLRWDHPTNGPILPDRFIPVAEESGLIVAIGEWVLEEACRQAALWQAEGYDPVTMAVNVSAVQLEQIDFVQVVQSVLQNTGFSSQMLHLEITETWIIGDPKAAAAKMRELQRLGIKISIDDFGIGHSSFGCLHDLPLDTLKIDQSFIAKLDGSSRQLATVQAIVMLAQQLGLRTVAEGVETAEQLQLLRSINCDLLQGFLLAKPLTPGKAGHLLKRSRAACP